MEITCNRCHQTVQAEDCYCPACGLPQLVYTAESEGAQAPAERWNEAVKDASMVDWKPAMRAALLLAVPAGLLSSGISPVNILGIFWMAAAAAWAVVLYMRAQRPAWITIGAGARIGLVTGLLAGWLAFSVSGGALFVERFVLHQPSQIDEVYKVFIGTFQQKAQQSTAGMAPADAARVQAGLMQVEAMLVSPEGHAGIWTLSYGFNCMFLVFFAAGGGALGARLSARSRRPEV